MTDYSSLNTLRQQVKALEETIVNLTNSITLMQQQFVRNNLLSRVEALETKISSSKAKG
jgi:outer membrane protein TolC